MTTWRKLIKIELIKNKESWNDIEYICPKENNWLDYLFDDDFGSIEGFPFTIWTKNNIYFPACYDGSEWVESIARNPNNIPTQHVGGG